MHKILFAILILFSSVQSLAGTIDEKRLDSEYIEYGKKHESVVKLEGISFNKEKEYYFYASAVIIKPRFILTATHVVQNIKKCNIVLNNEKIKVNYISTHALYKDEDFGRYDIALGLLEKDAKIDFYPELYDKNDEVGRICSISGFGVTGKFQGKERKADDIKRAGSNIIDSIDNDLLICSLKEGIRTHLEFLICHGDSGGGLFIDKKLAGINSCIFTEDKVLDANINDYSGHTRISNFITWINDTMQTMEKLNK